MFWFIRISMHAIDTRTHYAVAVVQKIGSAIFLATRARGHLAHRRRPPKDGAGVAPRSAPACHH
jgi:hypothetical protein